MEILRQLTDELKLKDITLYFLSTRNQQVEC